jgi:hypothetical protein
VIHWPVGWRKQCAQASFVLDKAPPSGCLNVCSVQDQMSTVHAAGTTNRQWAQCSGPHGTHSYLRQQQGDAGSGTANRGQRHGHSWTERGEPLQLDSHSPRRSAVRPNGPAELRNERTQAGSPACSGISGSDRADTAPTAHPSNLTVSSSEETRTAARQINPRTSFLLHWSVFSPSASCIVDRSPPLNSPQLSSAQPRATVPRWRLS